MQQQKIKCSYSAYIGHIVWSSKYMAILIDSSLKLLFLTYVIYIIVYCSGSPSLLDIQGKTVEECAG